MICISALNRTAMGPVLFFLGLAVLTSCRTSEVKSTATPKASQTVVEKAGTPKLPADEFEAITVPFLESHCYDCHGNGKSKGGVSLAALRTSNAVFKDHELAARVIDMVKSKEMPPDDEPQPKPAETFAAMSTLDRVLLSVDSGPGHRQIRRMNRTEYTNTIRDLLFLPDFHAADDFPKDENGYGFDTISDLLTVSPLLTDQYIEAAEKAVTAVNKDPSARKRLTEEGFVKETFYNKMVYARSVLEKFVPRAWRRPVTPAEIDRIYRFVALSFAQNGEDAKRGLLLAMEAVLSSPEFLFRVELNGEAPPEGVAPMPADYQLASRLSYFLWSSMPDEELFQLAGQNSLHEPHTLAAQVRRMLADPKARALTENFADQWLTVRNLKQATPDLTKFPTFTESLRDAMLEETNRFFSTIVAEDRSIFDFINADFTFVNEELATHYGMTGVTGREFQRVKLDSTQRGGILTQAAVLTVTSYSDRTSPVQRGKWILENVLNAPPPPPPPTVPAIEETAKQHPGATMRVILAQHRADPSCASCHQKMDPLGIAFENYDPIGRWRTHDGDGEVDAAGVLPNGKKFKGASELRDLLRARPEEFRRCFVEKLLTYGLGRGLGYHDRASILKICDQVESGGDHFSSVILSIIQSDLFQTPIQKANPPS